LVDVSEFNRLAGPKRGKVLAERVEAAAVAFANERFPEARRLLRPLVDEVPGSVTVRELLGLTQYRLGNWREAARQLEALVEIDRSNVDQHPVLADCYRAVGKHRRVDELWAELKEASPSAELVAEGRIVLAGSLADRGQLSDAVAVMAKGWKPPARPGTHHLRRAYVLADLQERVGDVPAARALMGWIAHHDPAFADAADRSASMR